MCNYLINNILRIIERLNIPSYSYSDIVLGLIDAASASVLLVDEAKKLSGN